MKKLIISILVILLIVLTGMTVVKGLKIGNINILGISELKKENDELDTKVKEATKLASTDYQKKIDELNKQLKELQSKKEEYLDLENVSSEQQINGANSLNQPYKMEYLYTTFGKHAKNNGIKIDMAFTRSSSGDDKYYRIAEFIMNIEDDSSLGFKVEEFKMTPSAEGENTLQATFVCKNIKIEDVSSNTVSTNQNTDTTTNRNQKATNEVSSNTTAQ